MKDQPMTEDELVVWECIDYLREHGFDVQIFASRYDDDDDETVNVCEGAGNWNARYGQIVQWYDQYHSEDDDTLLDLGDDQEYVEGDEEDMA